MGGRRQEQRWRLGSSLRQTARMLHVCRSPSKHANGGAQVDERRSPPGRVGSGAPSGRPRSRRGRRRTSEAAAFAASARCSHIEKNEILSRSHLHTAVQRCTRRLPVCSVTPADCTVCAGARFEMILATSFLSLRGLAWGGFWAGTCTSKQQHMGGTCVSAG